MLERNRLLQAREVEVSVGMAERPLTLDRAFGYGPINPEIRRPELRPLAQMRAGVAGAAPDGGERRRDEVGLVADEIIIGGLDEPLDFRHVAKISNAAPELDDSARLARRAARFVGKHDRQLARSKQLELAAVVGAELAELYVAVRIEAMLFEDLAEVPIAAAPLAQPAGHLALKVAPVANAGVDEEEERGTALVSARDDLETLTCRNGGERRRRAEFPHDDLARVKRGGKLRPAKDRPDDKVDARLGKESLFQPEADREA